MSLIKATDLKTYLTRSPTARRGCLVDTNILLAANFSLDHFHEPAVGIFETLIEERVPRFANVNVRSEFIHISRKIVIAQALLDLFHAIGTDLPRDVYNKLKSIKTRSTAKEKAEALFRLQDSEIEEIRNLFSGYRPTPDQDLWDWFCEDYLKGKIAAEWNWIEEDFGINSLSLREISGSQHLENELKWDDAVAIIEKTGIGSADAMIVNLLLQSKYDFLVSGDADIIFAMQRLEPKNKFVVVP